MAAHIRPKGRHLVRTAACCNGSSTRLPIRLAQLFRPHPHLRQQNYFNYEPSLLVQRVAHSLTLFIYDHSRPRWCSWILARSVNAIFLHVRQHFTPVSLGCNCIPIWNAGTRLQARHTSPGDYTAQETYRARWLKTRDMRLVIYALRGKRNRFKVSFYNTETWECMWLFVRLVWFPCSIQPLCLQSYRHTFNQSTWIWSAGGNLLPYT